MTMAARASPWTAAIGIEPTYGVRGSHPRDL
jgi:hypothetical protein